MTSTELRKLSPEELVNALCEAVQIQDRAEDEDTQRAWTYEVMALRAEAVRRMTVG